MARSKHPHIHADELLAFLIPADPEEQMELVVLANSLDALTKRLSARQVYMVDEDLGLPALECGCPLSMVLNADNNLDEHGLLPNMRASLFLTGSGGMFYGDVLMVGRGMVQYPDGRVDVDFVSLTPQFHDWRGPGHPVPTPDLPWNK